MGAGGRWNDTRRAEKPLRVIDEHRGRLQVASGVHSRQRDRVLATGSAEPGLVPGVVQMPWPPLEHAAPLDLPRDA